MLLRRALLRAAPAGLLLPRDAGAFGAQRRGAGTYPVLTGNSSIVTGMKWAYFPGYYTVNAGVPDATGTWVTLTAQPNGVAGSLTRNALGRAMAFDGLTTGIWATGASFPLASSTEFTVAWVAQANTQSDVTLGECHGFSWKADPNGNCHFNGAWYTLGAPTGKGYFQGNGVLGPSLSTNAQPGVPSPYYTMPTTTSVCVFTASTINNAFTLYVNGTQAGTATLGGLTISLANMDTISFGCRVQTYPPFTNFDFTSGQTAFTCIIGDEDTIVGALMVDTAGVVQSGAICTSHVSGSTNFTMSLPATGNATNDVVTFGPPLTRLGGTTVNAGFGWNRVLTGTEITSFSASPFSQFYMP